MSLTVSDAEEWVCAGEDPGILPPNDSVQASMDSKPIRILFKSMEELGLDWLAPEEFSLEQRLHINGLEMLAVFLALKTFLPALRGHHVLVCLDNRMVVAYINHQGSVRSQSLYRMAKRLLLWAQFNLPLTEFISHARQTEPRSGQAGESHSLG